MDKLKITFLDAASIGEDVALEPIARLGELVTYPFTAPEEVEQRVRDCDVLITDKAEGDRCRTAPQTYMCCCNRHQQCGY